MRIRMCCYGLVMALLSGTVYAQDNMPVLEKKCINDFAQIISKPDSKKIQSKCEAAAKENAHMMVVTLESFKAFHRGFASLFMRQRKG